MTSLEAFCDLYRFGVDCDPCLTFVCTHVWSSCGTVTHFPSSLTGGEETPIASWCGFSSFFLPMILYVCFTFSSHRLSCYLSLFLCMKNEDNVHFKRRLQWHANTHTDTHVHTQMHMHIDTYSTFISTQSHKAMLPHSFPRKESVKVYILIYLVFSFSPPALYLQSSQGGGHRTLLYGHAILLRHSHSGMVSHKNIHPSCISNVH